MDTRTESDDFISIRCVMGMQGWKESRGFAVFVWGFFDCVSWDFNSENSPAEAQ